MKKQNRTDLALELKEEAEDSSLLSGITVKTELIPPNHIKRQRSS